MWTCRHLTQPPSASSTSLATHPPLPPTPKRPAALWLPVPSVRPPAAVATHLTTYDRPTMATGLPPAADR